eukprot:TRINITY_DN10780_c0_g2_i3.p2 TRINITY_DN10780_c0_g2~~TRINITY_DN10780_c0_g2_i3.p2  ORF type:complete len:242 (+),score=23.28 TRINITY_DN10780_c0_g2_i3:891-1616(+)
MTQRLSIECSLASIAQMARLLLSTRFWPSKAEHVMCLANSYRVLVDLQAVALVQTLAITTAYRLDREDKLSMYTSANHNVEYYLEEGSSFSAALVYPRFGLSARLPRFERIRDEVRLVNWTTDAKGLFRLNAESTLQQGVFTVPESGFYLVAANVCVNRIEAYGRVSIGVVTTLNGTMEDSILSASTYAGPTALMQDTLNLAATILLSKGDQISLRASSFRTNGPHTFAMESSSFCVLMMS